MDFPIKLIDSLIRNRRSVKPEHFKSGRIPDEEVISLLENASWAPNHALTQPWRFMIFKDEGLDHLGSFHAGLYKQSISCENFSEKKYLKILRRPGLASHVVVLGMKRQESCKIPEVEEIAAIGCAVQNLLLSATARGIASYWGSGGMTYHDEMKKFLNLGPDDKCLGFLYLGYPPDNMPVSNRRPVSEWVTWFENKDTNQM